MKKLHVLGLVCRPSVQVLVQHRFASIFKPTPDAFRRTPVTAAGQFWILVDMHWIKKLVGEPLD